MIAWIERQLQRLGVIDPFDKNDVLNAQIENGLHGYEQVANKVRSETDKRKRSNRHLRDVLHNANSRANEFADLERLVRTQGDPDQ